MTITDDDLFCVRHCEEPEKIIFVTVNINGDKANIDSALDIGNYFLVVSERTEIKFLNFFGGGNFEPKLIS